MEVLGKGFVMSKTGQRVTINRALLLVNQNSRKGRENAEEIKAALQSIPIKYVCPDLSNQESSSCINAEKGRIDAVIVAGGDGAIHDVIPALLACDVPLAVVPVGTANNFARNMQIPIDVKQAVSLIAGGFVKSIDVGDINGHKFINAAGIGISARINEEIHGVIKRIFGKIAYVFYAVKTLLQARPFYVKVQSNGEWMTIKTLQVTICNGKHYGAGLVIDDAIRMDDGQLELFIPVIDAWWRVLPLMPAILRGKSVRSGMKTVKLTGSRFVLETHHRKRVDMDGEMATTTPCQITVVPKSLKVIVAWDPSSLQE
jgi:YegS/Rv2252/BmrU family lipid kinase